jgi:hypothetical protein
MPELGTRYFLRFGLALLRSFAELFKLALSRSFLGLQFSAFAFALSRSRAPWFLALFFALLAFSHSSIFRVHTFALLIFALIISCLCVYILGWVDFGTGIQVGAVVNDNGKNKFFLLFLEFCIGFSLEDLQKNTSKMCEKKK